MLSAIVVVISVIVASLKNGLNRLGKNLSNWLKAIGKILADIIFHQVW